MKITPKSFGKLSKDYVMTKMNQMLIQLTLRLGIHTLISCTNLTSLVLEYPVHEVQNIETDAISSILNRTILVDEMRRAIKKLKNGKSAGEDNVMNEVLKTAQPYLELPITKLMNLILESEKYPSSLCRNILVTLYKLGGGNNDPDNYRGISIGSCLAKLYSTILYHRILEVNDNVGLINNKQIGFLKGFRTADHLLVIDTIINEVVHKQKKKLFVAFIDLKKAYDKINRDALIFKLKSKGFSGKFLMSIVALVNNVLQIPKINGKLLPPIVTSTGLKQGDNLSPILFDIFFDDVELIFDSKCEPVVLSDELSLNHLLYADDMAILSLSSEGLQHSLDNLT